LTEIVRNPFAPQTQQRFLIIGQTGRRLQVVGDVSPKWSASPTRLPRQPPAHLHRIVEVLPATKRRTSRSAIPGRSIRDRSHFAAIGTGTGSATPSQASTTTISWWRAGGRVSSGYARVSDITGTLPRPGRQAPANSIK
jgi:hypothetical protein